MTIEKFLDKTENWIKKAGSAVEKTAIFATGYGAVAYLGGFWPFTKIKENEYQITRWITGHRGPALEGPRTSWYVPPFIKKTGDVVSREIQERDSKLHFRTEDNFEGDVSIQYLWRVLNAKGANKFHWIYGDEISRADEVVHSYVASEIGSRSAEDLAQSAPEYLESARRRINGETKARAVFSERVLNRKQLDIDLLRSRGAEDELIRSKEEELRVLIAGKDLQDESRSLYDSCGLEITRISAKAPDFVPESQRILSITQETERQARAELLRADATRDQFGIYLDAAEKCGAKTFEEKMGIALMLQERDNQQTIAASPNLTAVAFGAPQATPFMFVPQKNYAPQTPQPPESTTPRENYSEKHPAPELVTPDEIIPPEEIDKRTERKIEDIFKDTT
jgi:regulator of protease activity HflC (stomatin/prohibitin superfamily)